MQSLSEIDTTSKRASKAAGFSWGVAEEVGKAIRNLELFGLPGISSLNLYLKTIKKNHQSNFTNYRLAVCRYESKYFVDSDLNLLIFSYLLGRPLGGFHLTDRQGHG